MFNPSERPWWGQVGYRRLSGTATSFLWCVVVLGSLLSAAATFAQESAQLTSKRLARPRGTLDQPIDSPIFLGLYGQVGGGFHFDMGQPGGGAFILFRPGAASGFLDFLHAWNAGLVLQADYQKLATDRHIFSGDLIIRRYVRDMGGEGNGVSPFVGFGVGASKVFLPTPEGQVTDSYWSLLVEFGQEWAYRQNNVIFVKGQLRRYSFGGNDYSTWSVQAAAGIPLPW